MMIKKLFKVPQQTCAASTGLLLIRLVVGIAFMFHGFGKIQNPFHWMGEAAPVPAFLQALAALSEFGGGFAWAIGALVPLASFGIFCTMSVAVHMHAVMRGDPFVAQGGGSSYELALVYLCVAVLLLTAGPGKISIDKKIFGER